MAMDKIIPLGDQAALAYFPDEKSALRFAAAVRRGAAGWLVDIVQAYTSVAVFFNLEQTDFAHVVQNLRTRASEPAPSGEDIAGRHHCIPCCYELGQDVQRVAQYAGIALEDVIRLHGETEYTVYAIGFCPGFPYLGYLPAKLCGVPRLETPRLKVEAGSVGVTGRQTGIYTEPRPGGWNLIGRTPLELVNVADGYFPLRTGDRVQFERVDEREFEKLRGQRL
jgi:inhibitor of KinA